MWTLTAALGGAFVVIVLPALVGRHLLGIDASLLRVLLAGIAGVAVSGTLIGPQLQNPERGPLLLSLMIGVGLLTAMVALLVFDLLLPPGATRPLLWVGSLRGRVARTRRYSQILRIAGRHGLAPYLRGRGHARGGGPRELRQALQTGGTTFVKLGQLMSTRRDLFPAAYTEELSRLQDRVPPAPWSELQTVLRESVGGALEDVYKEFDERPLAAASIAQVHAAVLLDGTEVIVKVQRPGIRETVERDLDIVERLAATLHGRTEWARNLGLTDLATGFAVALREELDFRVEVRNMGAVRHAAAARGDARVTFPEPYAELSSERVLVMNRVEGVPLGRAEPESAAAATVLADTLLSSLLDQIMYDGVFHADPHPGNVLLMPDGRAALLDFGSVGRLDRGLRDSMAGLFLAVERGDAMALCDALLELTDRPEDIDEHRLRRALGQFSARHLGHGATPGIDTFNGLFQLVADFRLAVPPELGAVFRALATLEGTLTSLSPDFNMLTASRSYASSRLAVGMKPSTARDLARDELMSVLPVLRRLPRRVDRIGGALEDGRLSMNIRLFADSRDRRVVSELLNRVLLTFLGIFFGVSGVQLVSIADGPQVTDDLALYPLIGYHLLVLSAAVVLRTVYTLTRPPP